MALGVEVVQMLFQKDPIALTKIIIIIDQRILGPREYIKGLLILAQLQLTQPQIRQRQRIRRIILHRMLIIFHRLFILLLILINIRQIIPRI